MKRWGLVLAVSLAAAPAWAQQPAEGFYIGAAGSAVYTDAMENVQSIVGGGYSNDSEPNGGKVYAGYKRGRWAMELGYYYLGKYENLTSLGGQVADTLETQAIVTALVYEVPMNSTFSVFARAGIAFTLAQYECKLNCGTPPLIDTRTDGISGMMGLGVDMRLSERLSLRGEYEHIGSVHEAVDTQKFKNGYDMYTLGVRFMF
jgi:opacity protein-like surface antigen